jgi:ferredoxin
MEAVPRYAFEGVPPNPDMKVRYDRDTCIGMFQCVAEWDAFTEDEDAGKAILEDSEEVEDGIFEREVPEDAELDAKFAARACPVDAIEIYEDGEQIV